MRIAILGAGFAGLATTWYLLHHSQGSVTVDLYDPLPIGGGTSGLSSGLLHLYAGKHAIKIKEGEKKLQRANQLFSEASRAIGGSCVLSKGILRPAVTPSQIEDFKRAAEANDETEWWDKEKCEGQVPGLEIPSAGGGLFIKQGLTIDVETYLQGLWKACALLGTQFYQRAVINENELQHYDKVIFTTGSSIRDIKSLSALPVEGIKGQVLILQWPDYLPTLPFSLISEGYLTIGKDLKTCQAGATFERTFASPEPDLEIALPLIRKKIASFFPEINDFKVLECKAGVRAAGKNTHLPLMGRSNERVWFLTGLGSKGLLNHGYLGELLAQALLKNDTSLLPRELRYGL